MTLRNVDNILLSLVTALYERIKMLNLRKLLKAASLLGHVALEGQSVVWYQQESGLHNEMA